MACDGAASAELQRQLAHPARTGILLQAGARRSTAFALHPPLRRRPPHFAPQVDKVVINVPATTANLGPGFDSFGFALNVWNRLVVERADSFSMTISGEGSGACLFFGLEACGSQACARARGR